MKSHKIYTSYILYIDHIFLVDIAFIIYFFHTKR